MSNPDLVEELARAMCNAPEARIIAEAENAPLYDARECDTRPYWLMLAREVLPIIDARVAQAVEEAAKVADEFERDQNNRAWDRRQVGHDDNFNCAGASAASRIAAAIRKLNGGDRG